MAKLSVWACFSFLSALCGVIIASLWGVSLLVWQVYGWLRMFQ